MSLLHADADCFFASVELQRRPELADRPVAVATHIVMSATYPARARGVRGAMPLRQALKLCPELVVLPPQADYQSAGEALMGLFWRFAVQVEPGSMEEAFIDPGDADPVATAAAIRAAARDELGLPVTVGVARTKLLAKLASRRAKPDGLLVITGTEEARLRATLTIDDLWGVGPTTANRLADAGVTRLTELEGYDEARLRSVVGTAMARRLLSIRDGTDDATVRQLGPRRTVSASRTAMRPSSRWADIQAHADGVIDLALQRLAESHDGQAVTHRIDVQVTYADRGQWSTERRLPTATRDRNVLRRHCREMITSSGVQAADRPVLLIMVAFRLTGVSGSRQQNALPLF
ncbi:Y-family DNA polymerase [Microlunatus soli]|uniref:DNA polymerase-4 n=1 Tax=Microlunatus soli TaxID=630515 RepID=A0A1H1YU98_9ACTN|nr:DNA polymerase IV [Microlunatus soli]SDT25008.1 DNA polymerase-4 [Microlunatus soli]